MSLYDQPPTTFGGARLNAYAESWPPKNEDIATAEYAADAGLCAAGEQYMGHTAPDDGWLLRGSLVESDQP